jgi:hypothetical protein
MGLEEEFGITVEESSAQTVEDAAEHVHRCKWGISPVIRLDGGNSCSELRFDVKGLLLAEHLPHVVLSAKWNVRWLCCAFTCTIHMHSHHPSSMADRPKN